MSSSQSEPINGDNKRKQGLVIGVNGTYFWTVERAQQYYLVTIFGIEEVQIILLTRHLSRFGLAKKEKAKEMSN